MAEELAHKVDKRTEAELRKVLDILWKHPSVVPVEPADDIEDIIRGLLYIPGKNKEEDIDPS